MSADETRDVERDRLEQLAELDAYRREDDLDWQQRVLADPFSVHEALHLAHVFGRTIDEHLIQHPTVLLHPHLYAIASKAGYALAELYQAIGNVGPDEEKRPG